MRLTVAGVTIMLALAAVIIWLWGKRDVAASVFAGEATVTYNGAKGSVVGAARKD